MKEFNVNSMDDFLELEAGELLGILTSMIVEDENYDSVSMIIERLNTNHGDFRYVFSCERINENEDLSIIDKIKKRFIK